MATIITRAGKGSAITNAEFDANLNNLNNGKVEDGDTRSPIRPTLLLDFANTKKLDPRITFSRASTANYYDGKTVIKAEENTILYSQDYTQSNWTKYNTTNTANTVVSPDGTTTASTLTASAGSTYHALGQTGSFNLPIGLTETVSFYVKAGTSNYVTLSVFESAGRWAAATFDLSQITLTKYNANNINYVNANINFVANGWYRVALTVTSTFASNYISCININSTNNPTYGSYGFETFTAAGTETIYIWGAQLEQRSSVTAYTPTTTQAITNYIPDLLSAPVNSARFDHDPISGESKGLLIEEQRTNLLTYGQSFSNSQWIKTRSNANDNSIIAPDGTLTACKLIEDSTASITHIMAQPYVLTAASYTFTIYAKAGERSFLKLGLATSGTSGANFNLTTGAIGTLNTNYTASMFAVGNGWYRCSVTFTGTAATYQCNIYLATADDTISYTGNASSGIYIWGAQLETGAFATSYIPTPLTYSGRASTATYTGSNGLIQTAASNAARYQLNAIGTPQLLLESAASNLLSYSSDFTQSSWTKQYLAGVFTNNIIAPDGTLTGDRIVANTTSGEHTLEQATTTVTNQTYTQSIYVKPDSALTAFALMTVGVGSSWSTALAYFGVSSGTITSTNNSAAITSVTINKAANGWTRLSITYTLDGTVIAHRMRIYPITVGTSTVVSGDGVTGLGIWGAQLETGSVATSYIPSVESFTSRSTTASYYDSGTTSLAEQNLLLYSQTTTQWNQAGQVTVVPDTANTAAPDGSFSAISITPDNTANRHWKATYVTTFAPTAGTTITGSMHLKAGTYNFVNLQLADNRAGGGCRYSVTIDLTSGAIGGYSFSSNVTGTSYTVQTLSNGWYRLCLTMTTAINATSGGINLLVSPMPTNTAANGGDGLPTFSGDGVSYAYAWGAQVELCSSVTSYTPTTTAVVTNYVPTLLTAPINAARYDFDAVTRLYKGITLEAQATNLLFPSDGTGSFGNQNGIIFTPVVVPTGAVVNSGILYAGNASTRYQLDIPANTYASGTILTFSWHQKRINIGGSNSYGNFSNHANANTIKSQTFLSASGDNWERWYGTANITDGTVITMLRLYFGDYTNALTTFIPFAFWGLQVETGSVPTSYIPTTTAQVTRAADIATSTAQTRAADIYSSSQVTRAADIATITGTSFSSWYRQDEGTICFESTSQDTSVNTPQLSFSDALVGYVNFRAIYQSKTSVGVFEASNGSTQYPNTNLATGLTSGAYAKISYAYKLNDYSAAVNGGTVVTRTSGIPPTTINRMGINYNYGVSAVVGTMNIKRIAYYPARLTDTQITQLSNQ